jgi:hypothetical protein
MRSLTLALALALAACGTTHAPAEFADDYDAARAAALHARRLLAVEVWAPW